MPGSHLGFKSCTALPGERGVGSGPRVEVAGVECSLLQGLRNPNGEAPRVVHILPEPSNGEMWAWEGLSARMLLSAGQGTTCVC